MRPGKIDDIVGQQHIVGPDALIRQAIEQDRIFSMILWGPPGCGKTTLARIIAHETKAFFEQFSAVLSGVKDIRAVIEEAKNQRRLHRKKTILFVDEIHRFNKAQQDAFLQHVESGLITLIGATTENPSFEVIAALMSRCRVFVLNPLSTEDMTTILRRALQNKEQGLGNTGFLISDDALTHLAEIADGDVRSALNGLEIITSMMLAEGETEKREKTEISLSEVENALQKKALRYDKGGEEKYNLISAFHKSLRGSDPDAAVYWLARMISAGESALYVARRMVRFASEDVGNADPNALTIAMNAMESFRFLGHPEGELALVQAAVYLATAPKSNSLYMAYNNVKEIVKKTGTLPVPMHIRNAPTSLMKTLDYGKGYKYAHNYEGAYAPQDYLPEKLQGERFYHPVDRGYEKTINARLDGWRSLKKKVSDKNDKAGTDKK
ncbi:MAG: replication-associated recombination protein A [Desulfobacterales bacterium]|nr:replication-associated recombination protein A [Desulfobacterales bacterium]